MLNWCSHYHSRGAHWGDNWWFPIIGEEILVITRLPCEGIFLDVNCVVPTRSWGRIWCGYWWCTQTLQTHPKPHSSVWYSHGLYTDSPTFCYRLQWLKIKRNHKVSNIQPICNNLHYTYQHSNKSLSLPSTYHACWWERHVTCQMTTPQTSLWKSSRRPEICNKQYKMLYMVKVYQKSLAKPSVNNCRSLS